MAQKKELRPAKRNEPANAKKSKDLIGKVENNSNNKLKKKIKHHSFKSFSPDEE